MTRTDSASATYLYGVTQSRAAPRGARAPRGLPGTTPPRALDAGGGLWLIVADAPLSRYGPEVVERQLQDLNWLSRCALAHEAVVEHFARAGTIVPMKLFTLFSTDERAIAHVARSRKEIARVVARVAGREEWAVRLSLDERRALESAVADRGARSTGGSARSSSGTDFLMRKKAEHDAEQRLVADAVREAERVFDDLTARADDARRRTPVQGISGVRFLLDAAFLVRSARVRQFRTAVAARARGLSARGYELTLTGPWPPYHFVGTSE